MPKETIVNATTREVPTFGHDGEPSGTSEVKQLGLSLGWNRAGWVQIHMFPPEWETSGDWHIVDLDRPQMNQLIRALRKARDAAYGADA